MKKQYKRGLAARLARKYKVTPACVSYILNGKTDTVRAHEIRRAADKYMQQISDETLNSSCA
jgi:hypothetical protein